jgi:cell filamentation protein
MNYRFLDPDYTYTDPKTGILHNLLLIEDYDLLVVLESLHVSRRLEELEQRPIKVKGVKTLFDIHKYLFQDIYSWAGMIRTVEISKEGNPFFPTQRFDIAFTHIDSLIAQYRIINAQNLREVSLKLANILDTVNYLHPFREGNGRTQREFLRLLALEKKHYLNLNPADNLDTYSRYMTGTIHGDIEKLSNLILELISSPTA